MPLYLRFLKPIYYLTIFTCIFSLIYFSEKYPSPSPPPQIVSFLPLFLFHAFHKPCDCSKFVIFCKRIIIIIIIIIIINYAFWACHYNQCPPFYLVILFLLNSFLSFYSFVFCCRKVLPYSLRSWFIVVVNLSCICKELLLSFK